MKDHPLTAPPKNGEKYHKIDGEKVWFCTCGSCNS
jgi:hypothetical protein